MARMQAGTMPSKQKKAQDARRKILVFTALVGSLTATALLLQLLSPPPVRAQADVSLFAVDSPETITRAVYQSRDRVWKSIYIHHSKTPDGDAQALASGGDLGDHFIIGNGNGASDGEVQYGYRWRDQVAGVAPRGARSIAPDCISICLVGDFDAARPTAVQLRRLAQLVSTLQSKHNIPASNIYMASQGTTPAGIGRNFPIQDFRQQMQLNP